VSAAAPNRDGGVFARGAVHLVERAELEQRLEAGKPLRVKFGMDPSAPDLHLGHAVQLLKLAALQRAGHTIVLIVGDSTAMVGDPSGRNKLRPQLTRAEVEANLATYLQQVGKVLDTRAAEVHRNSEWFDAMRFEDVLRLAGRMTVARMIERDTFTERMRAKEPIGIHEFLYPLMQGWDSVMIRADCELGGTDQLFNLLVGRDLQQQAGQAPQVCFTLPLINGSDGRKMSKSYGNAIAFTASAEDMFGGVMAIPDEAMPDWYLLLTDLDDGERARLLAGHPREAKARLGEEIAARFHGRDAARAARAAFDRRFRDKEVPDDVPELELGYPWPAEGLPLFALLRDLELTSSSSDARRVVTQGGVRVDGLVVGDPGRLISKPGAGGLLLQVGKRRVARVRG
jgi:tyrosyl-tRNA synthetase